MNSRGSKEGGNTWHEVSPSTRSEALGVSRSRVRGRMKVGNHEGCWHWDGGFELESQGNRPENNASNSF